MTQIITLGWHTEKWLFIFIEYVWNLWLIHAHPEKIKIKSVEHMINSKSNTEMLGDLQIKDKKVFL